MYQFTLPPAGDKTIYSITACSIIYDSKLLYDCVDHNKLWKILQELGIPDHLTCLLRNLYAGQEAMIRIGHGTTYWFQIGKGVRQGCRVYHEKHWAGGSISWNQDWWEKYQ